MHKIADYIRSGKKSDHKAIKDAAKALLFSLDHTPAGLQKVLPNLPPIALFKNGLRLPNDKPPFSVWVLLDNEVFAFGKTDKNWKNYGSNLPYEFRRYNIDNSKLN